MVPTLNHLVAQRDKGHERYICIHIHFFFHMNTKWSKERVTTIEQRDIRNRAMCKGPFDDYTNPTFLLQTMRRGGR